MMPSMLPYGQAQFTYVGDLGSGGLGRVRKIRITQSNCVGLPFGSEWACKELNDTWNQNPTMRARFEREIAALKKMSHPNIISYSGENLSSSTERFYVMPLYTSNLRKFIAQGNKTGDWRFIAGLGVQLANAMQYAHNRGFIHRDLKPDNILFNPGQQLVIADWGLGYFVHQHSKVLQQLTNGGMGTEYYCSLEQWSTGKCDGRGDIYSLGMTLDEMVLGGQREISIGMGINGPATADTSPGAQYFNDILQRMTALFAEQRQESMQVVAAELSAARAMP